MEAALGFFRLLASSRGRKFIACNKTSSLPFYSLRFYTPWGTKQGKVFVVGLVRNVVSVKYIFLQCYRLLNLSSISEFLDWSTML
jgi:hypothetical protein